MVSEHLKRGVEIELGEVCIEGRFELYPLDNTKTKEILSVFSYCDKFWIRLIAMEKHKIWRHNCTGECLPISRDLAIDLLVYDGETSRNHVTPSWLNCWYILLKYSPPTSMEEYLAGPRTQPRCICKSSSQPSWTWNSLISGRASLLPHLAPLVCAHF